MDFIKSNWQWFVGGAVLLVVAFLFLRPRAAPQPEQAQTSAQGGGTTPLFIAGSNSGGGGGSFDESGSFDAAAAIEDLVGGFGNGGGGEGVESDAVQIARINAAVQNNAIDAQRDAFNRATASDQGGNFQGGGGTRGVITQTNNNGDVGAIGFDSGNSGSFGGIETRSVARNVRDLQNLSQGGVTLAKEFAVFDSARAQNLSLTKVAETLNRANFGGRSTHSVASLQAFIQSKGLPSIRVN